jgi:Tfp pilus assembly protein PilN
MRAVNLLPEKHRPRRPTGGQRGSSYVVLGALGAIVVAVLLYVLTANSINQAKTDIADAQAATARANAQAQELGAYGDFAKVKTQREDAVKQLAQSRMDWERLVRELAHVLPSGVWIKNANASDGAGDATSTSGPAPAAQPTTPASTSGADASSTSGGPVLTLQGCAVDQAKVAETLVRLRELQGAADVQLEHSSAQEDSATTASSSSGSGGECGATAGKPNYDFQVNINFDAPAATDYKPGAVPARLGGGQ